MNTVLKILHTVFHYLFTACALISFLIIVPMYLMVQGWLKVMGWIDRQDERIYYKLRPELKFTEQDIRIFKF